MIQGYQLLEIKHEFEGEATREKCLLVDYTTHICDCGLNCKIWNFEYFAIVDDKCPNQTLSTNQEGGDPCQYDQYQPLPINDTEIECYVSEDCDFFSLKREFTTEYNPYEMIFGGVILLTCFACCPILCFIIYYCYKCSKNLDYDRLTCSEHPD